MINESLQIVVIPDEAGDATRLLSLSTRRLINLLGVCETCFEFEAAYYHRMAERTGLEPATPGVTGRYSNQLNYRSR